MNMYGVIDPQVLKGIVDSAALGMDVTDQKLVEYIDRFKKYPETSVVVVNFYQAKLALELCKNSHVEACIAIAYPPLCAITTELKVKQAKYAVEELGIKNVLFTIDHSKFSDGKYKEVQAEIEEVVKAINGRAQVIVMPDFAHWNIDDCVRLTKIIRDAGGDTIKSTGGMGRREDPKKVAAAVNAKDGTIKVMGTSSIRNLNDTLDMMDANPDKIAISRMGFFTTLDEIHVLETVRRTKDQLSRSISGIIWHPLITEAEVKQYLEKSKSANLYGVSVDPRWVPIAKNLLEGSKTKVIARVDTPFGITPTAMKIDVLEWVVNNGPDDMEIQVSMNTAAFKSDQYEYVTNELRALVKSAQGRPVSVILQMPLLNKSETVAAVMMCIACGVSKVEPIHGFGKFSEDGAVIYPDEIKIADIDLLKKIVGESIQVQATGGIDRLIHVLSMIHNGADRLVLPNAVELLESYDMLMKRVEKYSKKV